jgi:hypothetical protein
LAAICASGEALLLSLIYLSAASTLQSSWVVEIEPGKHDVFVTSTLSGWSNNDVGLAWLEQVFQRCTNQKARYEKDWRLLIVDGHSSYLTDDFIDYCIAYCIILAVFPPYSTYTLQLLDVVVFKPLLTAYTYLLNTFL